MKKEVVKYTKAKNKVIKEDISILLNAADGTSNQSIKNYSLHLGCGDNGQLWKDQLECGGGTRVQTRVAVMQTTFPPSLAVKIEREDSIWKVGVQERCFCNQERLDHP